MNLFSLSFHFWSLEIVTKLAICSYREVWYFSSFTLTHQSLATLCSCFFQNRRVHHWFYWAHHCWSAYLHYWICEPQSPICLHTEPSLFVTMQYSILNQKLSFVKRNLVGQMVTKFGWFWQFFSLILRLIVSACHSLACSRLSQWPSPPRSCPDDIG